MNSIHQFIVKPIGERYNNEITIGDKKLIVNSSISDHKFVNREAEIVATPLAYKTKLKKVIELLFIIIYLEDTTT
jgi:hypothetical protein